MIISKKNIFVSYHIILTFIFVYIFSQFLNMKKTNNVYKFYNDYIMNKYCIFLYILFVFGIMYYDNYTAILLFILIILPFKCSFKEFFSTSTIPNTIPNSYISDDRFKMDEIAKDNIIRQIKSQIEFDPYKTNLSKNVIGDIYSKYFDNDIFKKLKNIDEDSKKYIASGNFDYVPVSSKADYDIITYQKLSTNTNIGINPIVDGINGITRS